MIEYRSEGKLPQKPHTVFPNGNGGLFYEQCITQDGFDGPFSILYHQNPPQQLHSGKHVEALWPQPQRVDTHAPAPLKRRHFRTQEFHAHGSPCTGRVPLLFNENITIGTLKPQRSDDFYFCNGDGDDLFFIFEGQGSLLSSFGRLEFQSGDYVVVPRGTLHRFELPQGQAQHWFWVESSTSVQPPSHYRNTSGQLRMDAPYTHRDFKAPVLEDQIDAKAFTRQVTKKRGQFTEHQNCHEPLDAVGWDGTIYPYVFPMDRFSPKTGQVHLPPTSHATFATEHALVCSFVPRAVDFGENAITCPYPHSNVDIEEVLFYAGESFTSRKGTGGGSVSFHPSGVPHGPHPDQYEKSVGVQNVQERAVMLDVKGPLYVSHHARDTEVRDYDDSWQTKEGVTK